MLSPSPIFRRSAGAFAIFAAAVVAAPLPAALAQQITPETVIVSFVPGSKDELKPGAKIFSVAQKKDDTLEAASVSVGRDGLAPPM